MSSAFNRFFFNDPVDPGNINFSLGKIDVFVIDDRAYFKSVRVGPASVGVVVGGRALRGCDLELSGSTDRAAMTLDGPGRVSFPLATGLPTDAWLWLTSEGAWLDYRSLGGWGAYFPPDVKFEEARDPVADLTSLASQGEGPYLEYKLSLPDTSESKRTTFKDGRRFRERRRRENALRRQRRSWHRWVGRQAFRSTGSTERSNPRSG